jgi:hypothetical protein
MVKCGGDFLILILESLARIEVERKDLKAAMGYLQRALELVPEEWDVIAGDAAFEPLHALPEFQILKKKYGEE